MPAAGRSCVVCRDCDRCTAVISTATGSACQPDEQRRVVLAWQAGKCDNH